MVECSVMTKHDDNRGLEARLNKMDRRLDRVEAVVEQLASEPLPPVDEEPDTDAPSEPEPEPTPAPEPDPSPEPVPEPDTPNTEPDEPWPGYAVDVEAWNAMVRAHAEESGKTLEQAQLDCDAFFTAIRNGELVLDASGNYVPA